MESLIESFTSNYYLVLMYLGFIILVASVMPRINRGNMISTPIVYLFLSILVFMFFKESPLPHPINQPYLGKRLTELGIVISLTAAGLKIKHPFRWSTWRYSTRLLLITMPLTIAAIALVGWKWLGFAPATALLIGAVIAPTDPVLASDVQTTPPDEDDHSNIRLTLSTEAGLNDGLAFPFTNMAILMAVVGVSPQLWAADWLMVDVLYKTVMAVIVGIACGWLLAKVMFSIPNTSSHINSISAGILALSLGLFPYGLAELLHSYGFIAVFVASCMFRRQEETHEHILVMHDFSEELERIMIAVMFTFMGVYLTQEFLDDFRWYMLPMGLIILFLIRPISGMIGLIGSGMTKGTRMVVAFYGVRGLGSVFYLLYAFTIVPFERAEEALAQVMVVILMSIFFHGLTARPVMERWLPHHL